MDISAMHSTCEGIKRTHAELPLVDFGTHHNSTLHVEIHFGPVDLRDELIDVS